MRTGTRPLYPQMCNRENCVRLPLFQPPCSHPESDLCGCGQVVQVENPCCPGERAEVMLSVDRCGNLVICLRRLAAAPCSPCLRC